MSNLQVVEYQGDRVLATGQLAESFGTEDERINRNFNRNQDRYKDAKHYFILQGNELKEFRATGQFDLLLNINKLYLWTEKGAWLHAKSLNTDKAWDAYEMLVDDYYRVKQETNDTSQLSPQLQFMIKMEQRQNALETTVSQLSDGLTAIPSSAKVVDTVNEYARWTRLGHNEIYNKVYDILKDQHGIDVRQRVQNERDRVQAEYNKRTGKWYAESTLKNKVNGIDVMVREECLNKFQSILSGMLAKEKIRDGLSVVQ